MLALISTATALISFGFSIQQFFRIARAGTPARGQIVGPEYQCGSGKHEQ